MNQQIVQLAERLFEGYMSQRMGKGELMNRAGAMGLPQSLIGHLGMLPEGQVSKDQVKQHLAGTQGTSLEQDIMRVVSRAA